MVSVLMVKVRGFEVLPSFQWSNWYPLFAVAKTTAVESAQVGVTNIETLPIAESTEETEKSKADIISSMKLEKLLQLEVYEAWLPQGMVTGMVLFTPENG